VRDRVIAAGLCGLSDAELQAVLARPRVLLELQKAVLLDGSAYWDEAIRRADARIEPADVTPAPRRRVGMSRLLSHAVTAATAACVVWLVSGIQLRQAREELQISQATNARLRDELGTIPPILPADLPEGPTELVTADPPDLPEGDPPDLPDSPTLRPSGV
jgi:hypothetical protein